MPLTEKANAYHEKMFPGYVSKFAVTDPEFIEMFDNYAFDEVVNFDDMDGTTRFLVILASLVGSQSIDEFRAIMPAALNFGVTPIQIKELAYQATAYLGQGPVFPFLKATNEILPQLGYEPPYEPQGTVANDKKREAGEQLQLDIFGSDTMNAFWGSFDRDTQHISDWLAAHCFGDFYSRNGLTLQQREMITLCFLIAHGGLETQATSHIQANLNVGNDRAFLIKVISQALPWIGFPKVLNALKCLNAVTKK